MIYNNVRDEISEQQTSRGPKYLKGEFRMGLLGSNELRNNLNGTCRREVTWKGWMSIEISMIAES